MKASFFHTEAGKAIAYIRKIALGLVKSRRENGHEEKVYTGHINEIFLLQLYI